MTKGNPRSKQIVTPSDASMESLNESDGAIKKKAEILCTRLRDSKFDAPDGTLKIHVNIRGFLSEKEKMFQKKLPTISCRKILNIGWETFYRCCWMATLGEAFFHGLQQSIRYCA